MQEGNPVMNEAADTTAGEPVAPTPEFMMTIRRSRNNPSPLKTQVHSLVPGVVVAMFIGNPENPEGSRTAAHAEARRIGIALRTHKDTAGIYWMMKMVEDSANGSDADAPE